MVKVSIIYPSDPAGSIPGEFGIDSFIRNLIRWAPDDVQFEVIGITSDPGLRPVTKWSSCHLGEKTFEFFPVMSKKSDSGRTRIPLSLHFTARLLMTRPGLHGDVLEFHRIEPSILYFLVKRPKNCFIHQDMKQILNPKSDILWRHFPAIFFGMEKFLLPYFDSIFTVSEAGFEDYSKKLPLIAKKIKYTKTFMNPEIFYPSEQNEFETDRSLLRKRFGLTKESIIGVFVGRLDQQKDPIFLVESFAKAAASFANLNLILIGDGSLHEKTTATINELGLSKRCFLTGLLPSTEIAQIHRGADFFLLGSAYEGMPIALLEAMGCGLPVVATAVGEVPKLITEGTNGELVNERDPALFASKIEKAIACLNKYRRDKIIEIASQYTPQHVLTPIYQNYRNLMRSRGENAP